MDAARHYPATPQAVHRTSSADRARRDAAAEERSTYLHAVGMMPRAFHLLRAMFATGPRVQPLDEVRARCQASELLRGFCRAVLCYNNAECRRHVSLASRLAVA